MQDLVDTLTSLLKEKGMTLVTAESCTGGGVAHAVTAVSGSSGWYDRGFIVYTNRAKQEMLSVREATLDGHGAAVAFADGRRVPSMAEQAQVAPGRPEPGLSRGSRMNHPGLSVRHSVYEEVEKWRRRISV